MSIVKPIMIIMIPAIIAIVAFNLGPPGALIHLAKFGFRKAAIPNKDAIAPQISKIVFTSPIFHRFI